MVLKDININSPILCIPEQC